MTTNASDPASRPRSVAYVWGTTPAERAGSYPCDPYLPDADDAYFRAVDVMAPAATLFRWLCQLKVAPYSYDLIDNGGRQSPRHLIPGLEVLRPGQRMMDIFTLVEFEVDRHLTLVLDSPKSAALFGMIAGSYLVHPTGPRSCRLVGKLLIRYPRGMTGDVMRRLLPWGDFLMMRKQFLTLKRLAEMTAAHT